MTARAEETEEPLTRKSVIDAAKGIEKFTFPSPGYESWYTPAEYTAAARAAMGGIALDPASSDTAQAVVPAEVYYTEGDDGLAQDWRADTVFINPPFSGGRINAFANKLLNAYRAGLVRRAVWLASNTRRRSGFACWRRRQRIYSFRQPESGFGARRITRLGKRGAGD